MDEIKVYLYFLRSSPNSLYGFTINKKYKKEFEEFRNMSQFIHGYKYMSDLDYKAFSNKNKEKMFTTDVLTSEKNDFVVIVTPEETDKLNTAIDNIIDILTWNEFKINGEKVPLKKKYLKFLNDIIEKVECNRKLEVNLDTLKIFYYICKETFTQVDDDDSDKIYKKILL